MSGAFEIGINCNRGKAGKINFIKRILIEPDITVPLEAETRLEHIFSPAEHINIPVLRGTVIIRIKIPLFVQNLGVRDDDPVAPPSLDANFNISGKVLPKVYHALSLGGQGPFLCGNPFLLPDVRARLRNQNSIRRAFVYQSVAHTADFRRGVIGLPVIQLGIENAGCIYLPAVIRHQGFFGSVPVFQCDMCNHFYAI